jgi:hypothetical protein
MMIIQSASPGKRCPPPQFVRISEIKSLAERRLPKEIYGISYNCHMVISGSTVLLDAPPCLPERPLLRPRIDGTHQKGLKVSSDNW